MNKVPTEATPVQPQVLRDLVFAVITRAGMPDEQARLLADLLVKNDLRGVFSHGSRQVKDYARLLRDGRLNKTPTVKVRRGTPVTMLVDGDGGLGYFPCWHAAYALVPKPESTASPSPSPATTATSAPPASTPASPSATASSATTPPATSSSSSPASRSSTPPAAHP